MTHCPRCEARLQIQNGATLVSSMHRGEVTADIIHGYSCIMCGYWLDISQEAPKVKIARGFMPNAEIKALIIKTLTDLWDDIKALRELNVGWKTIKNTLELPFATSTLAMHWRNLMLEREGVPIAKRGGRNYGQVKKIFKQQPIVFRGGK